MKPTHLILLSAASAVAVGHGFQVRFPAVAYRGPGTLRSDPASGAIRCGPSPRPSRLEMMRSCGRTRGLVSTQGMGRS